MLIVWPVHDLETEQSQYPGIMTIAPVLAENGFRSVVVTADVDAITKRIGSPESTIVAYSTPSAHASAFLALNRKVKHCHPDVYSVFGGAHPTFFPSMIEEDGVDAVCVGEGEYAMLDLVRARSSGRDATSLANWWIKEGGEIHRNPVRGLIENLDELPIPDHRLFREASGLEANHAIVMTGRGCPYGCTYCYNHVYRKLYAGRGSVVRRRSVDHVMRELHQLKGDGVRFIRFMDDLFIVMPDWVAEFTERYRDEINLPFSCLVRANLVTEEIVDQLKNAGCHRIMMGIEAGSESVRREILNRRMTDQQILDAARIIRCAKIKLVTANILAIPGGTIADDWQTVDLNIRARPSYASASILQAYPGTKIHDVAEHLGLLEEDHLDRISRGGFGYSTTLKNVDSGEVRQVENLHKFFPLLIWFPWLRPLVRRLIHLPPNPLFVALYMACVNIGIHLIAIPAGIGRPMLLAKAKRLIRQPHRRPRPRPEVVGP